MVREAGLDQGVQRCPRVSKILEFQGFSRFSAAVGVQGFPRFITLLSHFYHSYI